MRSTATMRSCFRSLAAGCVSSLAGLLRAIASTLATSFSSCSRKNGWAKIVHPLMTIGRSASEANVALDRIVGVGFDVLHQRVDAPDQVARHGGNPVRIAFEI